MGVDPFTRNVAKLYSMHHRVMRKKWVCFAQLWCQHIWYINPSPIVRNLCLSESDQHWFRKWLVAYSAPSHYPNQSWVIVNWALTNKIQSNLNQIAILSLKKMHMRISFPIWRPFCPGGNELKYTWLGHDVLTCRFCSSNTVLTNLLCRKCPGQVQA